MVVQNKVQQCFFKNRILRSNLMSVKSSEVTYFRGSDSRPSKGIIIQNIGNRMAQILDLDDGSCHRRHLDQYVINETDPYTEVINDAQSNTENDNIRCSMRLANKDRLDYRRMDRFGCSICEDS
jgi:hypothetical protein